MSWAKWDAEHRAAGVRVTAGTLGQFKVTSGGKHLGNIHKQGDGKHIAVTKVNGVLQSHEFATHTGALNHIRKTHGLPAVSAKKAASSNATLPHLPGMGLTTPKKTTKKAAASPSARDLSTSFTQPRTAKKTAAKKIAAPPPPKVTSTTHAGGGGVPHHDWSKWDEQHGSGGGVSSAERIAAQIRGSLGHSEPTGREVKTTKGKSGSVVSLAADARSTASHVQKKDMKRPAPVKGEKDQADAFRTKIRMAEYNRKKQAATAADPVNAHTPKTEQVVNPHSATPHILAQQASEKAAAYPTAANHRAAEKAYLTAAKAAAVAGSASLASSHTKMAMGHGKSAAQLEKAAGRTNESSANRLADAIKGVHAEQRRGLPKATPKHAPGSAEDLADKADAATAAAHAGPSYVTHQKAYQAHKAVSDVVGKDPHIKAYPYHKNMMEYHRFAADHPSQVIPAGVNQEHADEHAARFPTATPHMFHQFTDTASRRRSQRMYDAAAKASSTPLSSLERNAVQTYTGSGYSSMNNHLRGTDVTTNSHILNSIRHLDSAFNKQPGLEDDMISYRGVQNADKMFGSVGSRVGGEFRDLGYGSSASHAAVASGFGGTGALIRILHPKGSKLLKPSDVGSFGDSERELIMPRGSRFHVAADRIVTTINGTKQRMIDLVRK